jgi:hypothetical protein
MAPELKLLFSEITRSVSKPIYYYYYYYYYSVLPHLFTSSGDVISALSFEELLAR